MRKTKEIKKEDILLVSSFILFDACVFHEAISGILGVNSLNNASKPYQKFLLEEWEKILKIDYKPVFSLAIDLLKILPATPQVEVMLEDIIALAKGVVSKGVLRRHDFMGRIYHKLLLKTTGKFYATYYTSVPAATILSKLILDTPHSDWNLEEIPQGLEHFKILDPACGSGTLLIAIYNAMKSKIKDISKLADFHRKMIEDVIYGFDVLGYATHLTLTSLALQYPKVKLKKSNIYTLKYGVRNNEVYLGSLDLLTASFQRNFGTLKTLEEDAEERINLGEFDIIIMNPPFSRSSKPNKKYGFTDDSRKLSKIEKRIREFYGIRGSGASGLASLFLILGMIYLKEKGRLGAVLPRSFLAGASWKQVRNALSNSLSPIYVVSNFFSGEPRREAWNWSENTELGECMVVYEKQSNSDIPVVFINFTQKPLNAISATVCAHKVMESIRKDLFLEDDSQNYRHFKIENAGAAFVYSVRQETIRKLPNLQAPCTFSHPEINHFIINMYLNKDSVFTSVDTLIEKQEIELTIKKKTKFIKIKKIISLDGIDISSVKRVFAKSDVRTAYPVVWGQQASMNTIELDPQHIGYGKAKDQEEANRFWSIYSSDLLLSDRPHLNNDAVFCFLSPQNVLATAMWEICLQDPDLKEFFVLWFNSTFGILSLLGCAVNSQGGTFRLKNEHFSSLLFPDPEILTEEDLQEARNLFQSIKKVPFRKLKDEDWSPSSPRFAIDSFFVRILTEAGMRKAENITRIYRLIKEDPIVKG